MWLGWMVVAARASPYWTALPPTTLARNEGEFAAAAGVLVFAANIFANVKLADARQVR